MLRLKEFTPVQVSIFFLSDKWVVFLFIFGFFLFIFFFLKVDRDAHVSRPTAHFGLYQRGNCIEFDGMRRQPFNLAIVYRDIVRRRRPEFSYSSTASWVRNYRQHIQQRNTTRSNSWHPRFHFFSFSHSHTLIIIRFFIHPQELFVYVCMSSSSILLRLLFDFLSSFSRFQLPFFISRWHNGGRQFLLLLFPRTKKKIEKWKEESM